MFLSVSTGLANRTNSRHNLVTRGLACRAGRACQAGRAVASWAGSCEPGAREGPGLYAAFSPLVPAGPEGELSRVI